MTESPTTRVYNYTSEIRGDQWILENCPLWYRDYNTLLQVCRCVATYYYMAAILKWGKNKPSYSTQMFLNLTSRPRTVQTNNTPSTVQAILTGQSYFSLTFLQLNIVYTIYTGLNDWAKTGNVLTLTVRCFGWLYQKEGQLVHQPSYC